jgi:hypothetical protein
MKLIELELKNVYLFKDVIDCDNNKGYILAYNNIHNVIIKYKNGSIKDFCIKKGCKDYKPIYGYAKEHIF